MPSKLTLLWKEGIIQINRETGSVEILQGPQNAMRIIVTREQFDMFLIDMEAAISAALQIRNPTGVGYGGTIEKLLPKPKKSMQAIVDEIENVAQPHV